MVEQPTAYTYEREDCDSSGQSCPPIGGATGQTYTLTAADVGDTIRVQEVASNAGRGWAARAVGSDCRGGAVAARSRLTPQHPPCDEKEPRPTSWVERRPGNT